MSKGKDPAFLFYPTDFMGMTIDLNYEERGIFITLLCMQFLNGHISDFSMLKIMGEEQNKTLWDKFETDINGNYFNVWLDERIEERRTWTESRRKNRLGKKKKYDDTT